jgi:hypothetical protein
MLQKDCHIYLYPHSKVMITSNVFNEVCSLDPKDGLQLLYHQATPSYLTCLRGDEAWGRAENLGRKVFFMFTSAI